MVVQEQKYYLLSFQIAEFGMSPTIGHISLPQSRSTEPTKRFYSNKLAKMIDEVYYQHTFTFISLFIIGSKKSCQFSLF